MARDKHEGQRRPSKWKMDGPRIWIPLDVLQGRAWANLSSSAKALLMDLASQLRVKHGDIYNNGDLTTALKVLEKSGWTRRGTIHAAAKQLEDEGLIYMTRQGCLPKTATLYAVTWLPLNESPKLEITARGFPLHQYRLKEPRPQLLRIVEDEKRPYASAIRTENALGQASKISG